LSCSKNQGYHADCRTTHIYGDASPGRKGGRRSGLIYIRVQMDLSRTPHPSSSLRPTTWPSPGHAELPRRRQAGVRVADASPARSPSLPQWIRDGVSPCSIMGGPGCLGFRLVAFCWRSATDSPGPAATAAQGPARGAESGGLRVRGPTFHHPRPACFAPHA
jgi:hypothetical protein